MTIHLPNELQGSLRAEVLGGRFATEDEPVTEIVREYFRRKGDRPSADPGIPDANGGLGSIGALHEDAELLDEIVEHAMWVRENRPSRIVPVE